MTSRPTPSEAPASVAPGDAVPPNTAPAALTHAALTHFVEGRPRMVDVSDKAVTNRQATAEAWVRLPPEAHAALTEGRTPKGDPLVVAQLGGIQGAKRTADLILLCHPLPVSSVTVDLEVQEGGVRITATVKTAGQTGVEMEALSAVTAAALNLYDMLKAVSKAVTIEQVRLLQKSGGKSGDYRSADSPGSRDRVTP